MSPTAVVTERAEFRNESGHTIGVVTRRSKGELKSLALGPEESIWLDEEEQIATANAPRDDADNPFTNGDLALVTEPKEIVNRRRIGYSQHQQLPAPEETPEEPDPAPGGSEGGDGSAGSDEQGDETPQEPAEPQGKVAPPARPGLPSTEAQEAQAKAAASRAVKTAAADPKAAVKAAAAPPQGQRAPGETVATPEAQGK